MRADRRHTRHPFTVAACAVCDPRIADTVLPQLREVVRSCPHAVLVMTQCLLSDLSCTTMVSERGVMLFVQPCAADRVPSASVRWIGPLRNAADAEAVCDWLAAGRWDPADLPVNLRADTNLARSSRLN